MKRIEPLISFSHEHHHALSQARKLSRAATLRAPERIAAASEDDELRAAVDRAQSEHVALRAAIGRLTMVCDAGRTPDSEQMAELGTLLTSHVRYEERVVFELLQAQVAESTISASVSGRETAR